MGIRATYTRVSRYDWKRVQHAMGGRDGLDHREAEALFLRLTQPGEVRPGDRILGIEKDWHALHAFLTRELPTPDVTRPSNDPLYQVVAGGAETPFGVDFGRVRFLHPVDVRKVADVLASIPLKALLSRLDPVAFDAADIYTGRHAEAGQSLRRTYPRLVKFFRAAAEAGDVILLELG